jgi:hypothetical protein
MEKEKKKRKKKWPTGCGGEEPRLSDCQFFLLVPEGEIEDDSREESSLHDSQQGTTNLPKKNQVNFP